MPLRCETVGSYGTNTMKTRNNIALFGWVFSTVFLIFCGLMTYIVLRDGAGNIQFNLPESTNFYAPWAVYLIMGIFWLSGIGIAVHLWRIPCTHVEVRTDGMVVVTQRYLFNKDRRNVPSSMLHTAKVRETTDGEGDPYFECLLILTDGTTFTIAEGSVRKQCDVACALINTAIGKCEVVARG
jgi:hypothetical protein